MSLPHECTEDCGMLTSTPPTHSPPPSSPSPSQRNLRGLHLWLGAAISHYPGNDLAQLKAVLRRGLSPPRRRAPEGGGVAASGSCLDFYRALALHAAAPRLRDGHEGHVRLARGLRGLGARGVARAARIAGARRTGPLLLPRARGRAAQGLAPSGVEATRQGGLGLVRGGLAWDVAALVPSVETPGSELGRWGSSRVSIQGDLQSRKVFFVV
ncbi:unnamed protein product, partial [Prorocentrum cordatum]